MISEVGAGTVTYEIDALDTLTLVGGGWAAFAMANGAPHLATRAVGRSIWEFIGDLTTRHVYRDLFARVRQGHGVAFEYRCDAPRLRRFMQMTMAPRPHRGIAFHSVMLRTEAREMEIAPAAVASAGSWLVVCSWCKRMRIGDEWAEIEVAAQRLGLLNDVEGRSLTHGICSPCHQQLLPSR